MQADESGHKVEGLLQNGLVCDGDSVRRGLSVEASKHGSYIIIELYNSI